jgi:hypothetical protein
MPGADKLILFLARRVFRADGATVRIRKIRSNGASGGPYQNWGQSCPFSPHPGFCRAPFFQCSQLILDNLKYFPATIKEARRQLNPRPVPFRSFILASRA